MPFPSWDGFEGPDSTDCSTGGSLCREQDAAAKNWMICAPLNCASDRPPSDRNRRYAGI